MRCELGRDSAAGVAASIRAAGGRAWYVLDDLDDEHLQRLGAASSISLGVPMEMLVRSNASVLATGGNLGRLDDHRTGFLRPSSR